MTEEPQLGSIQQRIAALKQAQAAHPEGSPQPPFLRPNTERSRSANNPPSYNVTGSVLDGASIGNKPADERTSQPVSRPPPTPSRPEATAKKPPPPLPTRRSDRQPPPTPARPEARPSLPPRRPTDTSRRPSTESVTSNASHSTTATGVRGASTASINSNGNGRIQAPAWGETDLPALPPRRPKEDLVETSPPPRESKSSIGGLTSKISALRGKDKSSAAPSRPSIPFRPKSQSEESTVPQLPRRPSEQDTLSNGSCGELAPRLPARRPSEQEPVSNGSYAEPVPGLPPRRLPPTPSATDIKDARLSGYGGSRKSPAIPSRPSSTSTANGTPAPIPHGSRPDLSKLQATKPRVHSSMPASNSSNAVSSAECLVCRDFSGPDTRATQYPRTSLPTQDLGWLANELTAPFPSLTDKARVIFTWLHHNIAYDTYSFFNDCVKPSTPASTVASGLAVCEGYAGLFAALATKAGLEAIVISGHGKGYGHSELGPGAPIPPFSTGHAWNAVKIDGGRWKLIDACWGAGHVNGKNQPYQQVFSPTQFTMSNEEFGLKHFPQNKEHFFRDDGRPSISWEEYMRTNPDNPTGAAPIMIYSDADKYSIGRRTLYPTNGKLAVYTTPSPVHFRFGLLCEHWTLAHHSRQKPALFHLMIKGIDGRKEDRLTFNHVPGSGPGGGGEFWYVDVPEARMLGAPGQKVQLAVLTRFGDRTDCRGVTIQEYQAQVNRVAMGWAYIAEWELVH